MSNSFKELWNNRSLILNLSVNDVKLRYKNSILGFLWTFLEPLLMLMVLFFVFTNVIKSDIDNYPLYLLLGLIMWYMFSRATNMGLVSLTDRAHIIQKIYIQKEVLVISSCITAFIMMIFEFAVFGFFLVLFQFVPPMTIVLLPVILLEIFILSLGVSFLLSILNVYFKDIRFIWQVVLQAGFFITPIIYTLDMFPENIRVILELNPMAHIISMSHNLILYGTPVDVNSVYYLLVVTFAIFVVGYVVFRKKESNIAEDL
jgi:lipopolysaccharide transport system permease protein